MTMADKKGALLKKLIDARNNIRVADEVVKKHKEEYDRLAQQMIELMQEDGITMTGDKEVATASIRKTVVAQVTDWEKFYRYISRNKAYFLLQKRVSDVAYREILEDRRNKNIPGTEPFTKIGLNLRISSK